MLKIQLSWGLNQLIKPMKSTKKNLISLSLTAEPEKIFSTLAVLITMFLQKQ